METIINALKIIASGVAFMFVIAGIGYVIQKFFGTTLISKYNTKGTRYYEGLTDSSYNYYVNKEPFLVEVAIEKVKKKRFALTKRNVLDEIYKLESDKKFMASYNELKNKSE